MRGVLLGLAGIILLSSACSKGGGLQSKEAVRAAIEAYLRQRPNVVLGNMTLEVDEVTFRGEIAEAQAKFRSKQSPDLIVGVRYELRRTGSQWQVTSSSPISGMGMSPHGGAATRAPVAEPGKLAPRSSH